MAAKYKKELPLTNMPPEHFMALAVETVKKLGWSIAHINAAALVANTKFSMSSWGEEVNITVKGDALPVVYFESKCTGSQLVDWGKNKKNVMDFINTFNELKENYAPEQLDTLMQEDLHVQAIRDEQAAATPQQKQGTFLSVFIPVKGYFVTPILLILNIGIFIIMVGSGVNILAPANEDLLKWGANFRPATMDGEAWRLLTCCFLHIGIFHLLFNMYALAYVGVLLESRIGSLRFAAAYLLTGIASSVTSLYWHELTISAGASGAIFGMYGVFLALLTTNLLEKNTRQALLTSIVIFVAYNLLYGLKGGVDNAAHIGGVLSGLVIGYGFYASLKKQQSGTLKYATMGILAVLVLATSFTVYKAIPNDIARYDKQMSLLSQMEEKALEVYRLPKDASKEQMLSSIENPGLTNWQKIKALLQDADQLDIPTQLHERNRLMLRYCDMRINCYNFLYKAISENSEAYQDSINYYNGEIDVITRKLK